MNTTHSDHLAVAPPVDTNSPTTVALAVPAVCDPRFLMVAMDDDGCGNPVFCIDEAAVRDALLPLMFFLMPGETLDAEHQEQFDANVAALLEDGFLTFEGDPGIHLYRLHVGAAS